MRPMPALLGAPAVGGVAVNARLLPDAPNGPPYPVGVAQNVDSVDTGPAGVGAGEGGQDLHQVVGLDGPLIVADFGSGIIWKILA